MEEKIAIRQFIVVNAEEKIANRRFIVGNAEEKIANTVFSRIEATFKYKPPSSISRSFDINKL